MWHMAVSESVQIQRKAPNYFLCLLRLDSLWCFETNTILQGSPPLTTLKLEFPAKIVSCKPQREKKKSHEEPAHNLWCETVSRPHSPWNNPKTQFKLIYFHSAFFFYLYSAEVSGRLAEFGWARRHLLQKYNPCPYNLKGKQKQQNCLVGAAVFVCFVKLSNLIWFYFFFPTSKLKNLEQCGKMLNKVHSGPETYSQKSWYGSNWVLLKGWKKKYDNWVLAGG